MARERGGGELDRGGWKGGKEGERERDGERVGEKERWRERGRNKESERGAGGESYWTVGMDRIACVWRVNRLMK